ncbi:hypothetical protein QFC19_000078 [Naganishia cerealis]|uniref:Uncharacterized protein n=1 Tax=Naganishia cerealis TaxID=610337 RepID=A0ACC2WRR3_9TREE|nr:hypothetical protein QFC19_000078 [Naganishia cerealis]
MSSASPSNSMNPFALTDEDDDPSFPSSHNQRSPSHGHQRGLTSGSEPYPDGLPSRVIPSIAVADDDRSAVDDVVGTSRKNSASSYDDNEPPQSLLFGLAAESSSSISPQRLSNSHSHTDDHIPADSDIPSIDPESGAATAEQSMYMSYRPASNGNSQPPQSVSSAALQSESRKDTGLGSSSTPQPYDVSERPIRQRGIDSSTTEWNGKGKGKGKRKEKAVPDDSIVASTKLAYSDTRQRPDRGRSSDADYPPNHSSSRANSASPPPDLLRSPSSSVESIGVSTKHRTSGPRVSRDVPRDAAAEKRNLLPLPVTTPQVDGSSVMRHGVNGSAVGDVIFDVQDERRREKKRSSAKSRTEKHHRHSKRNHKHSRATDYVDDGPDHEEEEEQYPDDDDDDFENGNQRAMLMSTLSSQNESRTGRHKRSKKKVDPTAGLSEREKALWIWANVTDLDGYLQEVFISLPFGRA